MSGRPGEDKSHGPRDAVLSWESFKPAKSALTPCVPGRHCEDKRHWPRGCVAAWKAPAPHMAPICEWVAGCVASSSLLPPPACANCPTLPHIAALRFVATSRAGPAAGDFGRAKMTKPKSDNCSFSGPRGGRQQGRDESIKLEHVHVRATLWQPEWGISFWVSLVEKVARRGANVTIVASRDPV